MKIIAISDTHGLHSQLKLPPGDILIHAGDISVKGTERETVGIMNWFSQQDFKHKILIAGNHDFYFERMPFEEINKMIPAGIIYLNDSGIEIDGITFWGSPITPEFMNWAFNRKRGNEIAKHWKLIPKNTDVLITHGPPFGKLDTNANNYKTGCEICSKW